MSPSNLFANDSASQYPVLPRLTALWGSALGGAEVAPEENFFDAGGSSLAAMALMSKINREFGLTLPVMAIFEASSLTRMAERISAELNAGAPPMEDVRVPLQDAARYKSTSNEIAIVAVNGRFPGARSIEAFWQNLVDGVESITFFEDELSAQEKAEKFVAARPLLHGVAEFDAELFGISPREAETMDPQHRIFLECAWELLERAGYDPAKGGSRTGVFAGSSLNTYLMHNLASDRGFLEKFTSSYQIAEFMTMLGNDKDFLPTRVSYKLDLRGPSMAVQTACSTSLVAVCQACQSLIAGGCDAAIAGGVSITFPEHRAYPVNEGGLASTDGHCRPFDAKASGTLFGHGAAAVLLKRRADAERDGDQILAVIRGFAVNNDGGVKGGYAAPGIDGQVSVIRQALGMAGVSAATIEYVEAHGTATPLGDPIEFEALRRAFAAERGDAEAVSQSCAIGTAKGNVGHLDAAAGVTGLIKTVLQLEHGQIPGLKHFEQPNPAIETKGTPFYFSSMTQAWPRRAALRRAGVSAFGIGGTNAHVIVEEVAAPVPAESSTQPELLVWSARSQAGLDALTQELGAALNRGAIKGTLADVAFTLKGGRAAFPYRRAVVAPSLADAGRLVLETLAAPARGAAEKSKLILCFPGHGALFSENDFASYRELPRFKAIVQRADAVVSPLLGESAPVSSRLFPDAAQRYPEQDPASHLALFTLEYAVADHLASLGVRPDGMLGHSLGEFTAAVIADVLSFEDALTVLTRRALLFDKLPAGQMLAVAKPEEGLRPLLQSSLQIASTNSPQNTVVAGSPEDIATLITRLDAEQVFYRMVGGNHAYHTQAMQVIEPELAATFEGISLRPATIPILSSLTGAWAEPGDLAKPEYWIRQLSEPVRFDRAVIAAVSSAKSIFLVAGPAQTIHAPIEQTLMQLAATSGQLVAARTFRTLPSRAERTDAQVFLQQTLGQIWSAGAAIHWQADDAAPRPRRVLLPTTPFERKTYWIDVSRLKPVAAIATAAVPEPVTETVAETGAAPDYENELRALMFDLSGIDVMRAPAEANFFELGFDSLALTQLSLSLQQKFKVKISFQDLMDEQSTIAALTARIKELAAPQASIRAAAATIPLTAPANTAPRTESVTSVPSIGGSVAASFGTLKPAAASPVSDRQKSGVKHLASEFNAKTPNSKSHVQQHRHVLADPRVVAGFNPLLKELVYPLVVERAKGAYLWDTDGNRYIDMLNGFGCIYFGHSPDFVLEEVEKQMALGFPIGPQTELAGECAHLLTGMTGLERATFTNTGSEAVMAAMRVARTVTGRNLIAMFRGSYHGMFDEVLLQRGGRGQSMPIAPGIPPENLTNTLVLDYGTPETLEILRQRADELAAVLVEPIQSRHPELRPTEFLHQLRAITQQSGTALIFDEVVNGFRLLQGGAQAFYGIQADMATYGKVIGGGLPVGALAGNSRFMNALDGGQWQFGDDSYPVHGMTFFAGTFVRHPMMMAAMRACLRRFKEAGPSMQTELNARMQNFAGRLKKLFAEYEFPSHLESFASWMHFPAPSTVLGKTLYYQLRTRGVHIQESFPCFATTAHTQEDLETVLVAFKDSFEAMREAEALPAAGVLSAVAANTTEIPITEPQREVLMGTLMGEEANASFNESVSLKLNGPLDLAALQHAVEQLMQRHEVLTLAVSFDGDFLVPIEAERAAVTLRPEPITGEGEVRANQVKAVLAEEGRVPFDLNRGPLYRFRLLAFSPVEHQLVFTAHHIIVDGWSMNVLFHELGELYTSGLTHRASRLKPAASFAAYVQRKRATNEQNNGDAAYWKTKLSPLPPLLDLPLDRPRGAMRSNSGATRHYRFPAAVLTALRQNGAKRGSTLFSTLLTCYALMLHRVTRQNHLVIGVPVAAQAAESNDTSLVGHSVHFLPIVSQSDATLPFTAFLKQTRKALLEAIRHSDVTLRQILGVAGYTTDPSRSSLVEVQFNVETLGERLNFDGLETELSSNAKQFINMDLFFNFTDRGQELWLDVDYNTALFDADTIDRWVDHLKNIASALEMADEVVVGRIPLIDAEEQKKLLLDWNQTSTAYPRTRTITQVFEERAAETPEAIAVICDEAELSYGQLDEKGNQLARAMAKRGIRPGDRVATSFDRSLESIVGLLGILKAGAAYVPVDAAYPDTRIEHMLRDADVKLLLTTRKHVERFLPFGTQTMALDAEWSTIALEYEQRNAIDLSPDDLAYILYTSGSTGTPKGVLVPQRAVVRLVTGTEYANFSRDEILLQMAPLSFDASTFEIWGALLNGGRLVIAPEGRTSPEDLGSLIKSHQVTTLWLTAAFFHLMVADHLHLLKPLQQLLAGGDSLSLSHVQRVLSGLPQLRLINGYGPTENTTFSVCHTITQQTLLPAGVPIGRPIANTRAYILDTLGQPSPVGIPGELYLGGDGLAQGYLNAPELTQSRFVSMTLPFVGVERLYRTGDMARLRADGLIEFLGRIDTQVKVRGYRIELAEIEAMLEQDPLVSSAVVTAVEDKDLPGDKRLIAYIVPTFAGASANPGFLDAVRSHLRKNLPEYMQPSMFVPLAELPRTVNGKVDRRKLSPVKIKQEQKQPERTNYTPVEATLLRIATRLLSATSLSADDNLFEQGFDSLMVFRLCTLANEEKLALNPRQVFEYKRISSIAAGIDQAAATESTAAQTMEAVHALPRDRFRRKLPS